MVTEQQGWIKIHRKILDWEWYTDYPVFKLFIHLLITANHSPKTWRGQMINRGETLCSLPNLAAQTGLSKQQVRTALKKLESTHEITKKATHKYIVIALTNYEVYQDSKIAEQHTNNTQVTRNQHTNNTQVTRNQHTNNTQVTPNKNEKNKKNEKNEKKCYTDGELQKIVELFNSICISLPNIQMTDSRRRALQNSKIKDWEQLFVKVEASDFLSGRVKDWKASFDWIIKPNNAVKILEGNYDNKLHAVSGVSGTEKMAAALGEFVNGN